jgi:hypothetical protein
MLRNGRVALVGLGLLLLLPACNQDELDLLRVENTRLESEARELADRVSTLEARLRADKKSAKRARSCLLETRLTLESVARAVVDLRDPEAVFVAAGGFRPRFCKGVLKPAAVRTLKRQVAAADRVFSRATQENLANLIGGSTVDPTPSGGCNPNYSGCLRADASDYDCAGGSGDGPYYTGTVRVVGVDEYDLDRDGDGVGCN